MLPTNRSPAKMPVSQTWRGLLKKWRMPLTVPGTLRKSINSMSKIGAFTMLLCLFAVIGVQRMNMRARKMLENVHSTEESGWVSSYEGTAFRMPRPASLSRNDYTECSTLHEPPLGVLKPIDSRLPFLLILGAQKAGTTWLFDALSTHPLFVGAHHGYRRRRDKWHKEVHYFDQWPIGPSQEYLECFPAQQQTDVLAGRSQAVFVDASPEYLFTPVAAVRAQQVLPHAKFIIVLRDPVARSISAWRMVQKSVCKPDKPCNVTSLLGMATGDTAPSSHPPGRGTECLFNSLVPNEQRVAWGECWQCQVTVPKFQCAKMAKSDRAALPECPPRGLPTAHVGLYAPQLAWWLSFFYPDQFLLLSSAELRDPSRQVNALNKVLKHVGHASATPFTAKQIAGISGFQGNYSHAMTQEDTAAAEKLSSFYKQSNDDLEHLIREFFPEAPMLGFEHEDFKT